MRFLDYNPKFVCEFANDFINHERDKQIVVNFHELAGHGLVNQRADLGIDLWTRRSVLFVVLNEMYNVEIHHKPEEFFHSEIRW